MLFLIKYNEQTKGYSTDIQSVLLPFHILPHSSHERTAYIVFQARYIKNYKKSSRVSYSFTLKLLHFLIEIIWQSPMEEMFLFAEEGR